jgi:hypothetical protein
MDLTVVESEAANERGGLPDRVLLDSDRTSVLARSESKFRDGLRVRGYRPFVSPTYSDRFSSCQKRLAQIPEDILKSLAQRFSLACFSERIRAPHLGGRRLCRHGY